VATLTDYKHTQDDLKTMQVWPLERKIAVTQARIMEWYERYDGGCFVSYSGGLDSSILLDLARRCYPDIEAVYAATLDLPEVRKHIRATPNVAWVKPKMTFAETLKEYGVVFPSKDVGMTLDYAQKGSQWALNRRNGVRENGEPSSYRQGHYARWAFLKDSGFKISDKCCMIQKERPLNEYERKTGKHAIVGTRAEESRRRREAWFVTGCNAFNAKRPVSKPLSFWTHQNVLEYIRQFNIPYAECYGDIVDDAKTGKLRTTGEVRTGCVGCCIGVHLDKENRFQRLKMTHPKLHNYVINSLGLGEFLDFVGVDYGGRD
jgi:3'-phosphoadenosine 5'-phosphosulfate sulfotransferase (PAPS reductase)/FAD synthetase